MNSKESNSPILYDIGHVYESVGPTRESQISVNIGKLMLQEGDKTLQFLDDIHIVSTYENTNHIISDLDFKPDFIYKESATAHKSDEILKHILSHKSDLFDILIAHEDNITLSKDKMKVKLTTNGRPSCVLMDAALTVIKHEVFGFHNLVNILHKNYKHQQEKLHVLIDVLKELDLIKKELILKSFVFEEQEENILLYEFKAKKWKLIRTISKNDFMHNVI